MQSIEHPPVLILARYFFPSNIMSLINGFNLPEDSITPSTFDSALQHLNSSDPEAVLALDLKSCDLQKLLSEVKVSHLWWSVVFDMLCHVTNVYHVSREWREQVWHLLFSQRPSPRCPLRQSGLFSSSSCWSAWGFPPSLVTLREWWSP